MSGLLLSLSGVLALAVGLALGRAARTRWDDLMPRWLPAAVLVPGLLPVAWHFRRVSDFIAPVSGISVDSGVAGELEVLSLALPFAVVAIWGLAILLVRRVPLGAVAFPIVATALYLFGITRAFPHVGQLIEEQSDWLFLLLAVQIPMTVAVAGFLRVALGRPGLLLPWPLRVR
jgi:hypothetical protein